MMTPVNKHITADHFKELFVQYKNRLYGYVLTIAKSHTAQTTALRRYGMFSVSYRISELPDISLVESLRHNA